jgi:diguanylate cyclase (GGDEF)-like protein
MSESRLVVFLEGAPRCPVLEEAENLRFVHADSPMAAAELVIKQDPSVLVLGGETAWPKRFVQRLSPDKRPAVLGVGNRSTLSASISDEWVPRANDETLLSRLELAVDRARQRRGLAKRAFTDPLTGLANRRAVVMALLRGQSMGRTTPMETSLVLLDLDNFKQINERGGHPEGDRVLRSVGATLKSLTRHSEVAGRIGGDEFAMVLWGSQQAAQKVIERMSRAFGSLGVSGTWSSAQLRCDERLRELYRRADEALFERKHKRRRSR